MFYRQHWYYFNTVLFIVLAFGMGFFGHHVSHVQAILIFNFMAILVHQFEEYVLPGGFPYVSNVMVMGEKEAPDRYVLNKKLSFTINVIVAFPHLISPIFFPNSIWLGLMVIFFCAGVEALVHIVVYPIRMKKLYNPGMASTLFLSIPIGAYYVWYVTTEGLVSTSDYIWGAVSLLGFVGAMSLLMLPALGLASRQSNVPFTQAEMERGGFKARHEKERGGSL